MESFVIYGCVIKSRSPAATTIHSQGGEVRGGTDMKYAKLRHRPQVTGDS